MAKNFVSRDFPNLDDNLNITFKCLTQESIHPYDVFAELTTTLGELKSAVHQK
jgi:GTP cyclohydrolase FolE2